jgi:hypothetical protein
MALPPSGLACAGGGRRRLGERNTPVILVYEATIEDAPERPAPAKPSPGAAGRTSLAWFDWPCSHAEPSGACRASIESRREAEARTTGGNPICSASRMSRWICAAYVERVRDASGGRALGICPQGVAGTAATQLARFLAAGVLPGLPTSASLCLLFDGK